MERIRQFRIAFLVAAFALAVVFVPRAVEAHAVLVKSTPAEDATVSGPNVHFELQFNSKVDAERSELSLLEGATSSIALHVSAGSTPATIVADAQGLSAGDYTVRWQMLAHDGHITRGNYKIHVK